MRKRFLSTCIALCSVVLGVMAQRSYTFNAAALNVDGLPEEIAGYTINEGAPGAAGATAICNAIANSSWAFCGFSEDFNYHSELTAAPAKNYYNFGEHGGSIGASAILGGADTDGLGIACAKYLTLSGGTRQEWSEYNGFTDQGADGLISKGFRVYTVTFENNIAVDVYVLHMDAEDGSEDIRVRKVQLGELAKHIKETNKNKRPIIVLGDTNCRYTRDELKTAFVDVINADSRFTIKDAWVELMWNGVYPTYGSDAMMTHTYGAQKGEVVDKVFYINTTESNLTLKANSYLHDTSIAVSDHYPVVVNFTLTDPNGTPENVELEGPAGEVVLTDGTPTNPNVDLSGTYYLKNVASGLYLKAARGFGAQASEGVHAIPATFNKVNNNTYYITSTIPERDGKPTYLGSDLYFDNWAHADFTLQEIVRSDGAKKYMLVLNNQAVASEANGEGVGFAAYNVADTKQHWMLYTNDMIKEELKETLEGAFYNASTLIPYGRVDTHHADTRKPLWQGGPAFTGWSNHANHCMERWFAGNSDQRFDVYQDITGLPEGTYTLTAQAFHRDGGHGTSSKTVIPDLYATNGSSTTVTTKVCSINDASAPSTKPNNMFDAGDAFLNGSYNVTLDNVTVGSDGKLRIGVRNTSTASNGNELWCIFNNFQLLYHGTAQGDLKGTELYRSIKAAVEEADALIATQSAEVKAAYDISAVVYRYNNNLISTDGAWERALIDNAVMSAVKSQTTVGADMSLAIVNNSFEKGSTTGWTIAQGGWDTNAIKNEGNVATSNGDGTYQFNTWSGDQYECGMIYQTVTGLRNGYYRLNALVTSWNDRSVYLVGNKQHASIATTAGEGTFVDFGLDFLVEDGTALIGAVGAGDGGNFYFKKGIFFKADNFRLTYMGSTGEGRVKFALADAKAKAAKLHEGAQTQFNNAVAQYENATITGDGKTEETAIYNALKAAIATQPRTETDMTWMIANPGFETGDWTGWTTVIGWDTRVAHATDGVAPGNGEGQYVVNTWNDWVDAPNSGVNAPVYQTLRGLPNGRYRLTAKVTSDGGNQVTAYATVNGNHHYVAASPENNATFVTSTVEFDVTGGADVTIGAVGLRSGEFNVEGGCWYKCDNFRLTYLGHTLNVNEEAGMAANDWYTAVTVNRPVKADVWNTFVVPFDMAIPEGWTVKALTGSELNRDNITLVFTEAEAIEAGVPYMVRTNEAVDAISTENVQVITKPANATTDYVEFVGVYEAGKVPTGAFFISNNTFYVAADESNTIKAFRAYIQPTVANARSISYRTDEDETTDIEPSTLNAQPSTVIYDLMGRRVTTMVKGNMYIVNGKKVIVIK